tara:strand:- start:1180 stop:2280 length:1101 start_codon:yes stop_codon:yes gene_type:complete
MNACLVSAAEPSGDALAAEILGELHRRRPELRWRGCGGEHLKHRLGLHLKLDAEVSELSAAGLVELLPRLPALWRARTSLLEAIKTSRLAVLVDAPDLNLPLASKARELGVPVVLVAPPQWWAWRPGRLRKLAHQADLVLCLFHFEVAPLRAQGIAAHWIGHPASRLLQAETCPPDSSRLQVAVLPGSRPGEIQRNLRPLIKGVKTALARAGQPAEIRIPWRLKASPPDCDGVCFVRSPGPEILADCDLALVAAGTATLEAAALGVPCLIVAAAHPITAAIARKLLNTRLLGLPNILLGEAVVPELHQDLSEASVSSAVTDLMGDLQGARQQAASTRARLAKVLGKPGLAIRAADCIEPLLRKNHG